MTIRTIPPEQVDSVVDTFYEAFYDYPVMRFVLGSDTPAFDEQHAELVRLFVMGRVLSGEPLFGIGNGPDLEAAATVTLPQSKGASGALQAYRNTAWARLGNEARARYDVLCGVWSELDVDAPQVHLNMVGVRNAHRGKGHARHLVEQVIRLSDSNPQSHGVSLTTEMAANVPFYEHLGFEITGHARVDPGLETWNFFKWKNK